MWTSKADEKRITWALQNADDVTTRVGLPAFISDVLERNVCQYVSSLGVWQSRIDKRLSQGKGLTKKQTTSYEAWKLTLEPTFVFSKTKKALVHDPKSVTNDCVALKLHLHEEAEKLAVSSSHGTRYRLVLLSGTPSDVGPVPEVLEGGVPANMMPEAEADAHLGEEAFEEEEEDQADALCDDEQLHADQDAAFHMDQPSEESDGEDDYQVLGDTDDELEVFGLPNHVPKVKDFNTRASWKNLSAKGLVLLPRHVKGCSISYHKTGQQWQGFYPGIHAGLSSTWGGSTKRTEGEALLRVLRAIVQAHIATNPKDKGIWEIQLDKIQKAEAEGTAGL